MWGNPTRSQSKKLLKRIYRGKKYLKDLLIGKSKY